MVVPCKFHRMLLLVLSFPNRAALFSLHFLKYLRTLDSQVFFCSLSRDVQNLFSVLLLRIFSSQVERQTANFFRNSVILLVLLVILLNKMRAFRTEYLVGVQRPAFYSILCCFIADCYRHLFGQIYQPVLFIHYKPPQFLVSSNDLIVFQY